MPRLDDVYRKFGEVSEAAQGRKYRGLDNGEPDTLAAR